MTAPIGTGYPDWQRVQSRAAKLFVNNQNVGISGVVTVGPFFVGDIPYLATIFDVSLNPATFSAEYYLEEGLTTFLGDQTIDVPAQGGVDISLPVQGPWVLFRITPVGGVGYDLVVYEVAGPLANLRGSGQNNILCSLAQNVNAGATATVDTGRIWPGEAHWFVETALGTWTAGLTSISAAGTSIIIDNARGLTAGDKQRQIFLPATMIRLSFTNQTAGAGTVRAALVARPIEPGR